MTAPPIQPDADVDPSAPSDAAAAGGAPVGMGRKVSRYGAFMQWMLSDAFWRFRWLVLGVVLAGSAAVALQIKAIALTIYYTHLFEDDQPFALAGRTFAVRQSIPLLVGFGVAVLAALLISAVLQYASRVWTLRLRRRYAEFCSIRVLAILQGAPHAITPTPARFDDAAALALARSESLFCGRMVSIAVGVITPAISFLASVAALFYVNAPLTAVLMAMVAVCGVFLYRTNVYGAEQSHRTEKLSRGAIAEYRRVIQQHKSALAGGVADPAQFVRNGPVKAYLDAYIARLRVVADSELIGNLFLGVVLATILVALGTSAIRSGSGWERMVVYLVALRYALVTFRGGMRTITSFNRFYPQVRRYFDFVRWTGRSGHEELPPAPPLPDEYELRVTAPRPLEGSLRRLTISAGARVALCAPIEVNRYTLPFIVRCMVGEDTPPVRSIVAASAWATSGGRLPPGPIEQTLGLTPTLWDEFEQLAARAGLAKKLADQLPQRGATPIPEEGRDGINPGLKLLLLLLSTVKQDAAWVFLEAVDLAFLSGAAQQEVLNRLAGRVVVILFNQTAEGAGSFGESVAAVHDEAEQIGLGPIDWLRAHRTSIDRLLATADRTRKIGAEGADDEDDDADDV